jgi:hypothetical protein
MENDTYKTAVKLLTGPEGLILVNAFEDPVSTNVKNDIM